MSRRLRTMALFVVAFAMLAAGTGIAVIRSAHRQAGCHTAVCAAGLEAQRSLRVVIDSAAGYGLRAPAAIAVGRGRLWVCDSAGNSVTEFGWKTASVPAVWSGTGYQFTRPTAITAGRDRLWVASADSITEMSTADGKVIRVISDRGRINRPRALTLFGSPALGGQRRFGG